MARMEKAKRFSSLSRSDFARFLLVGIFVVAAGWLTVAVSAAGAFRNIRPDLALAFQPFDARARANLAERTAVRFATDRTAAEASGRLAREALERDATVVAAWRMLGLSEELQGRPAAAARLMALSQRFSRRDLPTQLWFIEERVRRDDIPGALEHYDIALRTSSSSANTLLPILVRATASSDVISPLADLLRGDPAWRPAFFMKISEGAPSASNIARLMEEIVRKGGRLDETAILPNIVHRMASERDFMPAWRIYRLLSPRGRDSLLRNGDFSAPNPVPPFDWQLANEGDFSAEQATVNGAGRGSVLLVRSTGGSDGLVALQALVLPPGRYRLDALTGRLPDFGAAQLRWQILCGNEAGSEIAISDAILTETARIRPIQFTVPAQDCPAQWLRINILAGTGGNETGGWVDSVRVSAMEDGSRR